MEHAKKMVLIPQEMLQRKTDVYRADDNNQHMRTGLSSSSIQTPGNTVNRLDAELSKILNNPLPKDEREKWKLYRDVLQRYLFFVNAPEQQEKIAQESFEAEKSLKDDDIIASVPVTYKRQIKSLLNFLSAPLSRDRIKWDERGVVSIDGTRIAGSNIIDLVNDVARHRKSFKAQGREVFSHFLRDLGTPLDFIGNQSYLRENRQNRLRDLAPLGGRKRKRRTSFGEADKTLTPNPKKSKKSAIHNAQWFSLSQIK